MGNQLMSLGAVNSGKKRRTDTVPSIPRLDSKPIWRWMGPYILRLFGTLGFVFLREKTLNTKNMELWIK